MIASVPYMTDKATLTPAEGITNIVSRDYVGCRVSAIFWSVLKSTVRVSERFCLAETH